MRLVVVQDRSRLFREGLARLLCATGRIHAIALRDEGEVLATCAGSGADAALVELAGEATALARLVAELQCAGVRVVGSSPAARRRPALGPTIPVVDRRSSADEVLAIFDPDVAARLVPATRLPAASTAAGELTARERQVLALIGTGATSAEIGARLGISAKTVEGRRQSIYAKLGVQNQAGALSVALRSGALGGERSSGAR